MTKPDQHLSAGTTEVRCYGCGSAWNNLDLAVAKRNDPKIISCCPERKPLDIDAWMERAVAAEQKLRALNEPQAAPVPRGYERRNIGKDGKPWSDWYYTFETPTPELMAWDGVYSYEYRPLFAGSPLPRPQNKTGDA